MRALTLSKQECIPFSLNVVCQVRSTSVSLIELESTLIHSPSGMIPKGEAARQSSCLSERTRLNVAKTWLSRGCSKYVIPPGIRHT